ncbi:MAG: 2-C-methyl-D-erythritol 2,4-cyclodiphosphate synthase [Deltaproteobacteria bacterium CG11_big_fil_rev_8_21_14_0_20_45_16]|nr:MAG: 2-C-methyl-D-erythritol 2,4-cyclodiphosphate synthase [Deltaproteobacteria bacterium CG11_big_fil_rev_8_21_14_0_20_45_16]
MLDNLRIGLGTDAHAFGEASGPIWVGGVQVEHSRNLDGHSDADVLVHALVDALLGALNMGDIGEHFPSSDPQWKGAPSLDFLAWTRDQLEKRGAKILSVDSAIMAQEPRMKPYIGSIRQKLSECLRIEASRVSVKSTTTDYLGFVGRKEGIAAQAVCLLALPEAKKS